MKKTLLGSTIVLAAALSLPLASLNAAEPEDLIKYRKNVMKSIGGHTGALFAIAGAKAGDPSHMGAHADALASSAMIVKDIFPPESADGDTRAKAEIWSDAEGFAAAVTELEEAAQGVKDAFDNNGDMGAALKALGGSCKGCHDDYRSD